MNKQPKLTKEYFLEQARKHKLLMEHYLALASMVDEEEKETEQERTKMDFATAFFEKISRYKNYLTVDAVQEMLISAASVVLSNQKELPKIILKREIDPDGMNVHIILQVETDEVLLYPEDVSVLRAILLTYDETKKAQLGEPLTMPTRLKDGRIVTEVVKEMLSI